MKTKSDIKIEKEKQADVKVTFPGIIVDGELYVFIKKDLWERVSSDGFGTGSHVILKLNKKDEESEEAPF